MVNFFLIKFKNLLAKVNNVAKGAVVSPTASLRGAVIGQKVVLNPNVTVKDSTLSGEIRVEENGFIQNSKFNGIISLEENCRVFGATLQGNISVGRYSSLWGPNMNIISGNQKVIIGNFCSIARNVTLQTFNHNHKKITTYFIGQNLFKEKWDNETTSKGNIVIENDVWIGAQCVILGGVTIGNGAVVAANSVVTADVPEFSIVAGTPAKVIGYRFDNNTIEKIKELQWWNWSVEEIKQNKKIFLDEFSVDVLQNN
ncbi:CatB-related O-acetyltransferase [Flavobacterium sp. U410]